MGRDRFVDEDCQVELIDVEGHIRGFHKGHESIMGVNGSRQEGRDNWG